MQPTDKTTMSGYLQEMNRRLTDRERANPIARASFHDGTRTRGAIGKYTHPDASEDYGAIFYDAAGNELLRVDDTSTTLATDSLVIADTTDATKHTVFDTSALTTGTVRTITMPDADVTLGGPAIGTATVDTSNDLNDGTTTVRTITAGSLATGWSIASNALKYTGTPNAVFVQVNVSFTSTGVGAAPVVELWKGGTKVAMAHTGFIANTTGHDEASANFTYVDTSPGTDPAYHLESSRGSTDTTAATPLSTSQFAAYVVG